MGTISRALLTATLVATVNATYTNVSTFQDLTAAIINNDPSEIEVSKNFDWISELVVGVGKTVIIRGNSDENNRTILDAQGRCRFFAVQTGGNLIISKLVLQNAKAQYEFEYFPGVSGGAVYNEGTFTSINCEFSGNYADDRGGAVYTGSGGTFSATNCKFSGNYAGGSGGAVYSGGTFTSTNCEFIGNNVGGGGGAVYCGLCVGDVAYCNDKVCSFTATNCKFSGNDAYIGSAVYNEGTFTSTKCEYSGNTAVEDDSEVGYPAVYSVFGTFIGTN